MPFSRSSRTFILRTISLPLQPPSDPDGSFTQLLQLTTDGAAVIRGAHVRLSSILGSLFRPAIFNLCLLKLWLGLAVTHPVHLRARLQGRRNIRTQVGQMRNRLRRDQNFWMKWRTPRQGSRFTWSLSLRCYLVAPRVAHLQRPTCKSRVPSIASKFEMHSCAHIDVELLIRPCLVERAVFE